MGSVKKSQATISKFSYASNTGAVVSTIEMVCVALVSFPQSSIAVNTRTIVKVSVHPPAIVSVVSVISTEPQLSTAEEASNGCASEHSAV